MIKKIELDNGSVFIGESINYGKNFSIGSNNVIKARHFNCGDNVTIGSNNNILIGKSLNVGACSSIGSNNEIVGLDVSFGQYSYIDSNIVVGHGGKMNYDSKLSIGDACMICSYVKLNINYSITLGDNVGIGEYVDIWTHGSYLPILEGYPFQFSGVKIGSDVWIPAKSTIMPGVNIGSNVVVGANTLVNRDLPQGSFCAGIPVKVLRENEYPKVLDKSEKAALITEALNEYERLCEFKSINPFLRFNPESLEITTPNSVFSFDGMTAKGDLSEEEEDLRDFLRRRGMKFFTGKPFRSIVPPVYADLIKYE